ncbi:DUF485 domain-containing protein [Streptomyces sp. NPDC059176]|uniref:DUF485 domain-containing protein n=1 Tax=Streptomyces sp. NPDC059176 TaxID=3346758 RepID=UPI00367CD5AC
MPNPYEQHLPDPAGSGQPWHTPGQPGLRSQHADDLSRLRSGYRRLRRVATLTALGYFTLFLIFSAYAPDLMAGEIGGLTTGLLLGLLQLPVTLAAIALYERIARRRVDPLAATIREHAEQEAEAHRVARAAHTARGSRPHRQGAAGWQRPGGSAGGAW